MFLMRSLEDLWEHVGYMVLCSPDSFPYRDFMGDDQMNLEKGFAQLHEGILIAYPKDKFDTPEYDALRAELGAMLDTAYKGYIEGDLKTGAFGIQDFRKKIFVRKGQVRKL